MRKAFRGFNWCFKTRKTSETNITECFVYKTNIVRSCLQPNHKMKKTPVQTVTGKKNYSLTCLYLGSCLKFVIVEAAVILTDLFLHKTLFGRQMDVKTTFCVYWNDMIWWWPAGKHLEKRRYNRIFL